ncbi:MAG: hypothetical protein HQM09_16315 [Candidatus Riflebacteria bacterium]|nr:hypothetical protein [Candidatus Riflebacteria bacterium]
MTLDSLGGFLNDSDQFVTLFHIVGKREKEAERSVAVMMQGNTAENENMRGFYDE